MIAGVPAAVAAGASAKTKPGAGETGTKVMTMIEAITDAMRTEMRNDDRVVVFGEDVGKKILADKKLKSQEEKETAWESYQRKRKEKKKEKKL